MNARGKLLIALLLCSIVTTGCWDMTEPNRRSLWVGSGMDLLPDGRIKFSAQILIPAAIGSEGGSKSAQAVVRTGVGASAFDAMHNLQEQLSRDAFVGHRAVLLVSESMAKHGIQPFVDEFERNPDSNLRAEVFVVQGESVEDFFKRSEPLEGFTTKVVKHAAQFSDLNSNAVMLHTFVNTSLSYGHRPFMQVIDVQSHFETGEKQSAGSKSGTSAAQPPASFNVAKIALFNQRDEMVGYLDGEEADNAAWVAGDLRKTVLTTYVKQGHGTVSLELAKVHRRIRSRVCGRTVTVYITLSGDAIIRENNSTLNMFLPQDIKCVKQAFDQRTKQLTQQVVTKVQRDYGTDIFGFGEQIHRHHPYAWRSLKNDWDAQFKLVHTVVDVDLNIHLFGNKGPSAMIRGRQG
ncbi:Ger(x)C family spore germination protein [Alicyclobacillus curvatus]|nr:Ger(x)C family spore germination protein [Alicyclobacillus curvatus]